MLKPRTDFRIFAASAVLFAILLHCGLSGADVLVAFPEGTSPARMSQVTGFLSEASGLHAEGVTVLRREPAVGEAAPKEAVEALAAAMRFYGTLDIEHCKRSLEKAEDACLEQGAFSSCRDILFDTYLLRGVLEHGAKAFQEADDLFRLAHSFAPRRVVDPRKFSPKIVSAFNRACSDPNPPVGGALEIATEPVGGVVLVNGEKPGGTVKRDYYPGPVIVEATMPGRLPATKKVVLRRAGEHSKPQRTVLELEPLPKEAAWRELREILSFGAGRFDEEGVVSLFARFGVEGVVILGAKEDGSFSARFATLGKAEVFPLPDIGGDTPDAKEALKAELARAMGLASSAEEVVLPPAPAVVIGSFESPDDDNEEAAIRFEEKDGEDENDKDKGSAGKIFKSPWFWISVGMVAVIGGTVAFGASTSGD